MPWAATPRCSCDKPWLRSLTLARGIRVWGAFPSPAAHYSVRRGMRSSSREWHSPGRYKRRAACLVCTSSSRERGQDESGPWTAERKQYLLKYVQEVQPQVMEQFADKAHPQVVDAMRQTVTNMLGTLPPQFFQVNISTVGENLAQLMYSMMMSGYMFRNAQYRMDLRNGLGTLLPGGLGENDTSLAIVSPKEEEYAPGVQKKDISGKVVRWNHEEGAETLEAQDYIEMLEREVKLLKDQVAERQRMDEGSNDLIEYLKSMEPHNLKDLTSHAAEDVLDAMNSFIQRLLGSDDPDELRSSSNETTAVELARMLYWLMVVGYSLRTIEVRFDMEQSMDLPAANEHSELPSPDQNL